MMNDYSLYFGDSYTVPRGYAREADFSAGYGLLVGIVLLAAYILRAIGQYRMAKSRGFANPWLAFIPLANNYQLGMLAGSISVMKKTFKRPEYILLLGPVISFVLLLFAGLSVGAISLAAAFANLFGISMIISGIVMIIAVTIIICMVIVAFAVEIAFALAFYNLFSYYRENNVAVFFLVLSLMVPLAKEIIICIIGSKLIMPDEYEDEEDEEYEYEEEYIEYEEEEE